jgi:hypothetical protein
MPQPPQITELSQKIISFGEDFKRSAIDDLADRGECDAVADPVKERGTEFVLQLFDRLADSRLGSTYNRGGAGKSVLTHNLNKGAERLEFHCISSIFSTYAQRAIQSNC